MKMKNSDLVLYTIHELKRSSGEGGAITRKQVSETLNIKDSSLNVYLSNLSKNGLIVRKKRHYNKELADLTEITPEGMEIINQITDDIRKLYFTPERHNIPSIVSFMELYNRYSNPLERIFLLNLYIRKYSFDLNDYLENLSTAKNEMSIAGYFRGMEKKEHPEAPYFRDVFKLTLYGSSNGDLSNIEEIAVDDVNSMIIQSESLIRQGRMDQAEIILNILLKEGPTIDQNQWFQIIINLSTLYMKRGKYDNARDLLDKTQAETKDRLLLACIESMKGHLMIHMGQYDEGLKYLSYALRSFNAFNNPLLSMIAHNNRGVIYFIQENYQTAEKEWMMSRKDAKDANSKNAEALILTNIADIHIKKGNLKQAEKDLATSERILTKLDQYDGLSAVYFNMALLEIAKKNPEEAMEYYELSEKVAFPLPGPWARKIRREEILKRCAEFDVEPIIDLTDDIESEK